MATLYQYKFRDPDNFDAVEDTLLLATAATESLHSSARMTMDLHYWSEPENRAVIVDGGTQAGQDLAAIFTHLLHYSLPEARFSVRRVTDYLRGDRAGSRLRGACGSCPNANAGSIGGAR